MQRVRTTTDINSMGVAQLKSLLLQLADEKVYLAQQQSRVLHRLHDLGANDVIRSFQIAEAEGKRVFDAAPPLSRDFVSSL